MRRANGILMVVVMLLALPSLYGCVGPTSRRFCNVSSYSCMALKAQQSKIGTISAQQARCC